MQQVYRDFLEEDLAIPVIAGVKTESEKFAGAVRTHTVEAMMGGKHWALQAGTAHNLGDHFGQVYDIRYLDHDGQRKTACSTSWGMSHRTIGALVMVHGDEAGLKLPPKVAPIQVVIVPIWRTAAERPGVEAAVEATAALLRPTTRVRVDWRDERTPGRKFAEWELKGVPLRVEIGPRDVASDQAVLVRRDTRAKTVVATSGLIEAVRDALASIQADLLTAAKRALADHIIDVDDFDKLSERVAANAGWSLVHWCGAADCEAELKTRTKATIRCIPNDAEDEAGSCLVCGRSSDRRVVVARAY